MIPGAEWHPFDDDTETVDACRLGVIGYGDPDDPDWALLVEGPGLRPKLVNQDLSQLAELAEIIRHVLEHQ